MLNKLSHEEKEWLQGLQHIGGCAKIAETFRYIKTAPQSLRMHPLTLVATGVLIGRLMGPTSEFTHPTVMSNSMQQELCKIIDDIEEIYGVRNGHV